MSFIIVLVQELSVTGLACVRNPSHAHIANMMILIDVAEFGILHLMVSEQQILGIENL